MLVQGTFSAGAILRTSVVQAASWLVCCWAEAPSPCWGYRWALEPPSWEGGCPSTWTAVASEAWEVALGLGVLLRAP